jgi:uncharacterized membrane protein
MTRIEGEVVIGRPVEAVFDFVADERNEPRYNPRIVRVEQISAGPIGVGTRFRVEARTGGRTAGMTMEVTGHERPRRLASSIRSSIMEVDGTLTFDPASGGTRLRWAWDFRLRGLAKPMTPLAAVFGRRQEKRNWSDLKRFLEAPVASGSSAGP